MKTVKMVFATLLLIVSIAAFGQTQVTIGYQKWMTTNLDVDKFRNGEAIPEAKNEDEWDEAWRKSKPIWCYYAYNAENGKKYGKLYNWYAVNDERGLAPIGYHIPTLTEWTQMINYLGGKDVALHAMKSTKWNSNNVKGTNKSGFSALQSGQCLVNDGKCYQAQIKGYWWTSEESFVMTTGNTTDDAWYVYIDEYTTKDYSYFTKKGNGYAVRCVAGELESKKVDVKVNEANRDKFIGRWENDCPQFYYYDSYPKAHITLRISKGENANQVLLNFDFDTNSVDWNGNNKRFSTEFYANISDDGKSLIIYEQRPERSNLTIMQGKVELTENNTLKVNWTADELLTKSRGVGGLTCEFNKSTKVGIFGK